MGSLDLQNKNLMSLNDVKFPENLQLLDCRWNQIKTLKYVKFPESLQYLYCTGNQITILKDVNFPESLLELGCYGNQITTLKDVKFPENLITFNCGGNQITTLSDVNFPESLQLLDFSRNQITRIENLPLGLVYLTYYGGNPIEYVDDVKYSDIKFRLRGYKAIRIIQKRMKRRYKIKDESSRLIGRYTLHWLHSVPNGPMFKRGWSELDLKE